jgi:hypothetical protein
VMLLEVLLVPCSSQISCKSVGCQNLGEDRGLAETDAARKAKTARCQKHDGRTSVIPRCSWLLDCLRLGNIEAI